MLESLSALTMLIGIAFFLFLFRLDRAHRAREEREAAAQQQAPHPTPPDA